jgi:hypothetical protein
LDENNQKANLYRKVKEFAYNLISEDGKLFASLQDAEDKAGGLWERAMSEVEMQAKKELQKEFFNDGKLKEILGDLDFSVYKKSQEPLYKIKLNKKIRELAKKLVLEGGKYANEYLFFEDQIYSIKNNAYLEARKQFGLQEKLTSEDTLPWLLLEPSKIIDLECTSQWSIPETAGNYILLSEGQEYIYPKGITRVYYVGESKNLRTRLFREHRKTFMEVRDNPKHDYYFNAEYEYAAIHGCNVCWIECIDKKDAEELEIELLEDFTIHYGAMPVANKQWSKKKTG